MAHWQPGTIEMPRNSLTPGALYKLLNDEFQARRRSRCQCRMPLPYLAERRDEASANWRIGTATPCPHGCDALIGEVVARFWTMFDLFDPTSTAASTDRIQKQ
jgi:hypothetical protein